MIEDVRGVRIASRAVTPPRERDQPSFDSVSKTPTFIERVAKWFNMRDATRSSFGPEILGGISMFLSSVYMTRVGSSILLGLDAVHAFPEGSCEDVAALASAFSIVLGVCTTLNGLVAGAPCVSGPGISFCIAYSALARMVSPPVASSANAFTGLILIPFVFLIRRYKLEQQLPDDFRIGLGAGIGVMVAMLSLRLIAADASMYTGYYLMAALAFGCMLSAFQSERWRLYAMIFGSFLMVVFMVMLFLWNHLPVFQNLAECPVAPRLRTYTPQLGKWNENDLGERSLNSTARDFNLTYSYRYIVIQVLEKLFNVPGTVATLVLLRVDTKVGYTKETFRKTLLESRKLFKVFLLDCVMNCLLVPFMGVGLVTPYAESASGIILGAHTGLSSVVAGSLFLLTSPVAYQLSTVFGLSSSVLLSLFACFFIVASMRHVEHVAPVSYLPGYLAFLVVPTSGVAVGAAFGFVAFTLANLGQKRSNRITAPLAWVFGASVLILALIPQNAEWSLSRHEVTAACASVLVLTILFSWFIFRRNRRWDAALALPAAAPPTVPSAPAAAPRTSPAESRSAAVPSLKPPLVLNVRPARAPGVSVQSVRPPGLASIKAEYACSASSDHSPLQTPADIEAPLPKGLPRVPGPVPPSSAALIAASSARPRATNKEVVLLDDTLMTMAMNRRPPTKSSAPPVRVDAHLHKPPTDT